MFLESHFILISTKQKQSRFEVARELSFTSLLNFAFAFAFAFACSVTSFATCVQDRS